MYWEDSTGIETVTSYWEALAVQTPSVRSFTVSLPESMRPLSTAVHETKHVAVSPRLDGCEVEYLPWGPVPERRDERSTHWRYVYDPAPLICSTTHLSSVLQNGGFPLDLVLQPESDGGVGRGRSWVAVGRSEIMCRTSCMDNKVIVVPLPNTAFEPADLGGPFAAGNQVMSAGSVRLNIEFENDEAGDRTDWFLGGAVAFDTSDRVVAPPPLLTSIRDVTPPVLEMARLVLSSSTSGKAYATTRRFEITNDEPVVFEVDLVADPSAAAAGIEPCVPSGNSPQSYQSDDFETSAFVEFDDLCLGEKYALQILATDADGVEYDVQRYRPELAHLYTFWAGSPGAGWGPIYTADIEVSLELAAPPYVERPFSWVYRIGDFRAGRDSSVAGGGSYFEPRPRWFGWAEGWITAEGDPSLLCRSAPEVGLPPPRLMYSLESVTISESHIAIMHQVDLRLQEFTRAWRDRTTRCFPEFLSSGRGTVSRESTRLVSSVTLTELRDGVTISYGDDEVHRITLRLGSVISYDGIPGDD